MNGPLAGLTVLNTRPVHQAAKLTTLLKAQGAAVHALPLLAIAPAADMAAAAEAIAAAADFWVVTSANAARALPARHTPPARVYALGAGTAAALAHRHLTVQAIADGSSEALLLHPELQSLRGQHGVLVKGEGGRELLMETLSARGARMRAAALYRREPVTHSAAAVATAVEGVDIAIVTSGEALKALLALVPPLARESRLNELPLLLPSERVAVLARDAGLLGELLMPEQMSDAALLARVLEWQQKHRP